jgi:hypothetical protein
VSRNKVVDIARRKARHRQRREENFYGHRRIGTNRHVLATFVDHVMVVVIQGRCSERAVLEEAHFGEEGAISRDLATSVEIA